MFIIISFIILLLFYISDHQMSTLEELTEKLLESRRQNQDLQQRNQQLIDESARQRREISVYQSRFADFRSFFNETSSTLTAQHVRSTARIFQKLLYLTLFSM